MTFFYRSYNLNYHLTTFFVLSRVIWRFPLLFIPLDPKHRDGAPATASSSRQKQTHDYSWKISIFIIGLSTPPLKATPYHAEAFPKEYQYLSSIHPAQIWGASVSVSRVIICRCHWQLRGSTQSRVWHWTEYPTKEAAESSPQQSTYYLTDWHTFFSTNFGGVSVLYFHRRFYFTSQSYFVVLVEFASTSCCLTSQSYFVVLVKFASISCCFLDKSTWSED